MATYYLNADTGVDSGAGTSSGSPWLTIAYALAHSTTGDTLAFQKSTAHFAWATATSVNRIMTGVSGVATDVVIDASGASVRWRTDNSGTLNLSNLRFTNTAALVGLGSPYSPFWINPSGVFVATNCLFDAITCFADATSGLVSLQGSASLTLTGCAFSVALATGNYMFNYWQGGGFAGNSIVGCTFYLAGSGTALTCNQATDATYMTNCILVVAPAASLSAWIGVGSGTVTVNYCCWNGIGTGGATLGTGIIHADPLFVDAPNLNFNLRPTSPCIDAGAII